MRLFTKNVCEFVFYHVSKTVNGKMPNINFYVVMNWDYVRGWGLRRDVPLNLYRLQPPEMANQI